MEPGSQNSKLDCLNSIETYEIEVSPGKKPRRGLGNGDYVAFRVIAIAEIKQKVGHFTKKDSEYITEVWKGMDPEKKRRFQFIKPDAVLNESQPNECAVIKPIEIKRKKVVKNVCDKTIKDEESKALSELYRANK